MITIRNAMRDLREEFLYNIFKGYPDRHQKIWKPEEIEKAFSSAMYDLAIRYVSTEEEREEDRR